MDKDKLDDYLLTLDICKQALPADTNTKHYVNLREIASELQAIVRQKEREQSLRKYFQATEKELY